MPTPFPIWSKYGNNETMLVSSNVVEKGIIVKGVYTLPTRTDILTTTNLEGLRKFIGVTNRHWSADAQAIKCMELNTDNALNYRQMFAMVKEGIADYLLYSFVNYEENSLHIEHYNTKLVPVNNVKVLMNDTLNYFISNKFDNSGEIYNALEKGLEKLHLGGEIAQLYEAIGYKNPQVESWQSYSCAS